MPIGAAYFFFRFWGGGAGGLAASFARRKARSLSVFLSRVFASCATIPRAAALVSAAFISALTFVGLKKFCFVAVMGSSSICTYPLPATAGGNFPLGRGNQSLTLRFLASYLACAPDSFGFLTNSLFGRFLVSTARLHFAEQPFTLHFLLEDPKGLIDIVIPNENLQNLSLHGGM